MLQTLQKKALSKSGLLVLLLLVTSGLAVSGQISRQQTLKSKAASLAADIDGNGTVNLLDYTILFENFGQNPLINPAADLNGDSIVNILDYGILFASWGQTNPTSTPTPSTGALSMAMGKWTPNPKYDTCPNPTDTARIKDVHDSYKVLGPDGKWYPTWHPPVDAATGCKFGHEHGRDPALSMVWHQAKEYFYFDANQNGVMDSSEEAVTGLPFGYANEQLDAYNLSKGFTGMRHEDHVGHKVEWANDETDTNTHGQSTTKNTGVWIGDALEGGGLVDTGVRCFFLAKAHQGTSTPDAFTNNPHEVFYFQDCRYASNPSAHNAKISFAQMIAFGAPGGFNKFTPMCGTESTQPRLSASTLVCPSGKDANGACIKDSVNQNYPSGPGAREIITRDCVEIGFLVPDGSWSGNMYEAWPAALEAIAPNGRKIVTGINLLFDANDANRYYYPESLKQQRGYNNPDAKTNLGFTMDLCYDSSLLSQGRKYRGGGCDYVTNYGQIKDIKWDDPRSGFRGLNRGMYFQPAVIDNSNGPQVWYTDPYGKSASSSPFPGSIKQLVEPKNINYNLLISTPTDPRVIMRVHNDGNGTVHAPN